MRSAYGKPSALPAASSARPARNIHIAADPYTGLGREAYGDNNGYEMQHASTFSKILARQTSYAQSALDL